jgi:hypothetical protein
MPGMATAIVLANDEVEVTKWRVLWLALFSLEIGAIIGAIAAYNLLHWDGAQFLLAMAIGGLACGLTGILIWRGPATE